jgi:hypothetical protein
MTQSIRVAEFDLWRPGYDGATVEVLIAGTNTLAALFSDPALTMPLPNPQILATRQEVDGTTYGRFAQKVYVGTGYSLRVNTSDQTAASVMPLTTLAGQNASAAVATATRGSRQRTLAAHLDAEVYVDNFGQLGVSPTANKAVLDAAIGAASAQGGGLVRLPVGNWTFTQISLPQDVVLVGQGRGATTLRSEQAQAVVTIGGDGAGLQNLTLDGVNLNVGSIGVLGIGRDRVVLDNVIIKRFAQGILLRGGDNARFRELYVQNCTKAADLRGDRDALFTNTGGPLRDLFWDGGAIEACVTEGLRLSFEDDPVLRSTIRGVRFATNVGPAVALNGCRVTTFEACRWTANAANFAVTDDNDLSRVAENTIQQLQVRNSSFAGGTLTFNGLCEDVRFEGCDFADVDWVLSVPTLPILLVDCIEDSAVTATGAIDRLMRSSSFKVGEFPGVTTDANWTTAWSSELEPGDVLRLRGRVIARQRNGTNLASYEIVATYTRPGSTLTYASASATPVVGSVVTGGTSGASARVVAVSGTNVGTVTLRSIEGAFINAEALTFSGGVTATASSTLTPQVAALDAAHWALVTPTVETDADWDVRASVTGNSAQLQVRGDSGHTVEWVVEANVLRP